MAPPAWAHNFRMDILVGGACTQGDLPEHPSCGAEVPLDIGRAGQC